MRPAWCGHDFTVPSDPLDRFDGRTIRVDKASDNGPRGQGRGGFGRGGYGAPQQPYGMGAPGPGYGGPGPNMYQAQYGRGYPQQQGYGGPPQGECKTTVLKTRLQTDESHV